MIERPLFLATPLGPLAAVITLPDGDPIASVMVMQGYGGTRSGANQMLTRMARAFADEGVATLRGDYAGASESFDADPSARVAGVRSLAKALRELVPDAPLFLYASCYGTGPAASIIHDVDVAGVAVVSPLVLDELPPQVLHQQTQPVRRALGRLRHRLRYGSRRLRALEQDEGVGTQEAITEIAAHVPTYVLAGSDDRNTPLLFEFLDRLPASSAVELEVAEGCAIHAATTLEAQEAAGIGVRKWVLRCVDAARSPG